jgi:four helix bundle protein
MKNFRDLKIWQKGHQLVLLVYRVTQAFPKNETYGLISQMRRAAASIPANIAEGCGRVGDAEFNRFLGIAMGSASELEYHFVLAKDLDLLSDSVHEKLMTDVEELKRMLAALISKISRSQMAETAGKRRGAQSVAER